MTGGGGGLAAAPGAGARVGLGGDARGHRRQLHHLCVRRLLPAERDDGQPCGEDGVDPLFPVPAATEDADDDHVGVAEQRGQVRDHDAPALGAQPAPAGGPHRPPHLGHAALVPGGPATAPPGGTGATG